VMAAFPTIFFGIGSVLSGNKSKNNKKWRSATKAA